jgi:hypothetical protein
MSSGRCCASIEKLCRHDEEKRSIRVRSTDRHGPPPDDMLNVIESTHRRQLRNLPSSNEIDGLFGHDRRRSRIFSMSLQCSVLGGNAPFESAFAHMLVTGIALGQGRTQL